MVLAMPLTPTRLAQFRWGATVVAYRGDRIEHSGGRPILDWDDLLQVRVEPSTDLITKCFGVDTMKSWRSVGYYASGHL